MKEQLEQKKVKLFRMANQALDALARTVCGSGFLQVAQNGKGAS